MERIRRLVSGAVLGSATQGLATLTVSALLLLGGCRTPEEGSRKKASDEASKVADDVQAKADTALKPKVEPMPEKAGGPQGEPGRQDDDVTEEDSEPSQDELDVKPLPGEDPHTTLLRMLRDRAEERVMWARGVLARESEIKSELERLQAEEARLGILRAIPESHEDASVEAEWQGLAQIMGFKIEGWLVAKSKLETRELPKELPADKQFELGLADIRSVYQVVVTIPRLPDAELARLLEGVKLFQRLTLIRRIRLGEADKYVINAEVYMFNPTDVPKFLVPERSIEAAMSTMGINLTVSEAVRRDPIGYVQTAALAYAEYTALRDKVSKLVVLEGQSMWLKGRRAFWEAREAEVKALKLDGVLKHGTVGGK